jgi:hypothetical protein
MAEIMTDEVVHVLETTIMLLLVILTGLFLNRKNFLDERSTKRLSIFVVDIAFPALVFTSMLRNIDPQNLSEFWLLPFMGIDIFLLGMGIGYLVSPLFKSGNGSRRGSVAFTIGTPNWLFIPLPIAIALYGDLGQEIVLLVNVGALLVFWSVGVWMVRGGKPDFQSLRRLVLNPGLLATVFGIIVTLAFPMARTLEQADVTGLAPGPALLSIVLQAMAFVGGVTVPLSMIVTGSLLAESGTRGSLNVRVISVSAIRLLLIPVIVMVLIRLAEMTGLHMKDAVSTTLVIISAMPVAITCSIVAKKHGGDVPLVSHSIFTSTMASVITVPAIVWLMRLTGFQRSSIFLKEQGTFL